MIADFGSFFVHLFTLLGFRQSVEERLRRGSSLHALALVRPSSLSTVVIPDEYWLALSPSLEISRQTASFVLFRIPPLSGGTHLEPLTDFWEPPWPTFEFWQRGPPIA